MERRIIDLLRNVNRREVDDGEHSEPNGIKFDFC